MVKRSLFLLKVTRAIFSRAINILTSGRPSLPATEFPKNSRVTYTTYIKAPSFLFHAGLKNGKLRESESILYTTVHGSWRGVNRSMDQQVW